MKNMVSIVFLTLILAAGGASAQSTDGGQGRVISSADQGQRNGDAGCEQIGSDIWECWMCEEDHEALQTSCITWESDDQGGWDFFRKTTRSDVANKP